MADVSLQGEAYGAALANAIDRALSQAFLSRGASRMALLALGSYGRRELCPMSDVDVMLVHDGAKDLAAVADACWYPLWDAGFVTGHATRTVKEADKLAAEDLSALTSMLHVRVIAGDVRMADELVERIRRTARKRRERLMTDLAAAAVERQRSPGPIAELVEPNVKDGWGGLRDLHALEWIGSAHAPPRAKGSPGAPATGIETLVTMGLLSPADVHSLAQARSLLLQIRVAMHRITARRSDDLLLQDQEAVAVAIGAPDADVLMRDLTSAARAVTWVADEVWTQLRDDRVARFVSLSPDESASGDAALRLANEAAQRNGTIDRESVRRLQGCGPPRWSEESRRQFVALLRSDRVVPIVESLDRTGVFGELMPCWRRVRSLPQRNAYHRHTVDRHLLEAVAECNRLLADASTSGSAMDPIDRAAAASLPRPHLLALGALLHDIAKGLPGDHSVVGRDIAEETLEQMGFAVEECDLVGHLVQQHLLMPDVATRRDLSEEATVARLARVVGDVEALTLLYLLTIGDSIATGPSAWSSIKASLVRELYVKTRHLLERGEVIGVLAREHRDELTALIGAEAADRALDQMPASYALAFSASEIRHHHELLEARESAIEWMQEEGPVPPVGDQRSADGETWMCTVVARDRQGMLASVTGVLAVHGLDVQDAQAFTRADGMALEVYRVRDIVGSLRRADRRHHVGADIEAALSGAFPIEERLRARVDTYGHRLRRTSQHRAPEVIEERGASDFATVIEVHADDAIGLLYRIASTLARCRVDVRLAKVTTIGDRVVDAFYVRDEYGEHLTVEHFDRLRQELLSELREVSST